MPRRIVQCVKALKFAQSPIGFGLYYLNPRTVKEFNMVRKYNSLKARFGFPPLMIIKQPKLRCQ